MQINDSVALVTGAASGLGEATARRLAAQGADVFVTGGTAQGARLLPTVPGLHPLTAPLALIATYYACVEALARQRGFDPDTPPHLRKVTETM